MNKTEKIKLIVNLNSVDLSSFKRDNPLSYAYLCFQDYIQNFNGELIYINEDKNRVYFKIEDLKNNKTSRVMDILKEELLKKDIYVYNYYMREFLKWKKK